MLPQSLESSYHEKGRAGRDGDDTKCVLIYTVEDYCSIKKWIIFWREILSSRIQKTCDNCNTSSSSTNNNNNSSIRDPNNKTLSSSSKPKQNVKTKSVVATTKSKSEITNSLSATLLSNTTLSSTTSSLTTSKSTEISKLSNLTSSSIEKKLSDTVISSLTSTSSITSRKRTHNYQDESTIKTSTLVETAGSEKKIEKKKLKFAANGSHGANLITEKEIGKKSLILQASLKIPS
nr:3693_t:CDS:2 [Entrophospora candida]